LRLGLCSQCRGLIHACGLLTHDPEKWEPLFAKAFLREPNAKGPTRPGQGLRFA
jgi:hypothetical protein